MRRVLRAGLDTCRSPFAVAAYTRGCASGLLLIVACRAKWRCRLQRVACVRPGSGSDFSTAQAIVELVAARAASRIAGCSIVPVDNQHVAQGPA
jgi:hypothetical protein